MSPEEKQLLINIAERLDKIEKSDRYVFSKNIQLPDGRNVQLAKGTGTKLGTETTQKLGLYGVTPVVQQSKVNDPTISTVSGSGADATINTNFTNLDNAVEAIIDVLEAIGISSST